MRQRGQGWDHKRHMGRGFCLKRGSWGRLRGSSRLGVSPSKLRTLWPLSFLNIMKAYEAQRVDVVTRLPWQRTDRGRVCVWIRRIRSQGHGPGVNGRNSPKIDLIMLIIDTIGAREVQLYGAMQLWCVLVGTFGKQLRCCSECRLGTGMARMHVIISRLRGGSVTLHILYSLQHPDHDISLQGKPADSKC